MAIYHFTSKIIGRSSHNTVGALAYRTGTDMRSDFSHKDVAHVELLCSEEAPSWVHDLKAEISENREVGVQHLSDICELAEKRLDSQVYRECEFALPHELNEEQNYELARVFIHDQFTREGMSLMKDFRLIRTSHGIQKKNLLPGVKLGANM